MQEGATGLKKGGRGVGLKKYCKRQKAATVLCKSHQVPDTGDPFLENATFNKSFQEEVDD